MACPNCNKGTMITLLIIDGYGNIVTDNLPDETDQTGLIAAMPTENFLVIGTHFTAQHPEWSAIVTVPIPGGSASHSGPLGHFFP
jgi:hypothetical protein